HSGQLPRVVLCGPPNAGKSSLLNALTGENAAIVSDVAGTTRDFVTRRAKFSDGECLITDTAGISAECLPNALDAAAQAATREQISQADLVLCCLDASQPLQIAQTSELNALLPDRTMNVWTKCDLPRAGTRHGKSAA